MRRTLTITDLTQMGNGVCIAGIDGQGNCVRPVVRGGVRKQHLFRGDRVSIYPRANVEFDLSDAKIQPPHTEDKTFDPTSIKWQRDCHDAEWERVLNDSCSPNLADIFDGYLEHNRRVPPGSNTRSLGTIADVEIDDVFVDESFNKRRIKLDFVDSSGELYSNLPVNDLAFIAYFHHLTNVLGSDAKAETNAKRALRSTDRVYLRIGLARPIPLGSYERACWTQVTGIYTFPDYLKGKNFADLN